MHLISEKEVGLLIVVVYCCAIKKNVIVASQLYDVADVQFTVEKEGSLQHLQFIQKYNFENSVPNIVIMLCIFLTIAVSVATCEQRQARIRIGSELKPILAGSGLDRTAIFFKLGDREWNGLRKSLLF